MLSFWRAVRPIRAATQLQNTGERHVNRRAEGKVTKKLGKKSITQEQVAERTKTAIRLYTKLEESHHQHGWRVGVSRQREQKTARRNQQDILRLRWLQTVGEEIDVGSVALASLEEAIPAKRAPEDERQRFEEGVVNLVDAGEVHERYVVSPSN